MLRQRMYHLVIYQLSGIQAGIQAGHAKDEFSIKYGESPEYQQWLREDKVVVILNGGTTNHTMGKLGTMHQHVRKLTDLGIPFAMFMEEDLNDSLTAIAFLVDEKVWNRETYWDINLNFTQQAFRQWLDKFQRF